MTEKEQFKKDCIQLGELLLKVDGTTRTFSSSITVVKGDEKADFLNEINSIPLMYFDTADSTGELRYRIVVGITEI